MIDYLQGLDSNHAIYLSTSYYYSNPIRSLANPVEVQFYSLHLT